MADDLVHPTFLRLSPEDITTRLDQIKAACHWEYSDFPRAADAACSLSDSDVRQLMNEASNKCFSMEWAESYFRFIELERVGASWILPFHGRLALASFNRPLTKALMEGAFVRARLCMEAAPTEVTAYCTFAVGMFEMERPASAAGWLRLAQACPGIPSQIQRHVIDFIGRWSEHCTKPDTWPFPDVPSLATLPTLPWRF